MVRGKHTLRLLGELPGWMLAILIEIASKLLGKVLIIDELIGRVLANLRGVGSKLLGNVFEIDGLTWSTLAISGRIGRKLLGNIFGELMRCQGEEAGRVQVQFVDFFLRWTWSWVGLLMRVALYLLY